MSAGPRAPRTAPRRAPPRCRARRWPTRRRTPARARRRARSTAPSWPAPAPELPSAELPSTPAPLHLIEPRIAHRDQGVDQSAKALCHVRYGRLSRHLSRARSRRDRVKYATARDEAAHDGTRRRGGKLRCLLPAAGSEGDEHAAAVGVACPDHPGATLPPHLARLRVERPPVRADPELVEPRQNARLGVGAQYAEAPRAHLEGELPSLRPADRGEPPQVTFLRLAQLPRILRGILK